MKPNLRVVQLTPAGRAGIATVRIEGPGACARVDAHFDPIGRRRVAELPPDRVALGHFQLGQGVADEVLVCRPAAEAVEIHCHGGPAVVERLAGRLLAAGGRLDSWQEWVRGRPASRTKNTAREALAGAITLRGASILLNQFHGALDRALEELRGMLERGEFHLAAERLQRLLALSPCGCHLTRPWRVVLAGRPNAGKSSLINALVGYRRAIVHERPGTTRDVVTTSTAVDGWPVELADTAGLRPAESPLELGGIHLAERCLRSADLVLLVVDAADFRDEDDTLRRRYPGALIAANKIDLPAARPPRASLPVSALHGTGIDRLLAAIAGRLVPDPPRAGEAAPFTQRQADGLRALKNALDRNDCQTALARLNELSA